MIEFSKNIYLEENGSLPADRSEWQDQDFEYQECIHEGRTYQVCQVDERLLSCAERVLYGLAGTIAVVATLGIALIFSSTVREYCAMAINGSEKKVYWKPIQEISNSGQDLNFSNSNGIDRLSLEDGLPLKSVDAQTKSVLQSMVAKWNEKDLLIEYSVSELSEFLGESEKTVKKLLDLVCLLPDPDNKYDSVVLIKLFNSIEMGLSNNPQFNINCMPGAKALWSGRFPMANLCFGCGSFKDEWNIEELGRFLAVSKNKLQVFLGERKDQYSKEEIEEAFNNAENRTINTLIEGNRTQQGSIRWALLSE